MDLWIVGAGGLGREVLDACLAAGRKVAGFLDEFPPGSTIRGLPVAEPTGDMLAHVGASQYVIGIADPGARCRLSVLLDGSGLVATTVVHPSAQVAPETTIGPGGVLLANAYVSSAARMGAHCQVQYNATLGHDVNAEDFVTVYPGANVSGSVRLSRGVSVGSNSVVLQGLQLEEDSFVGAGAVVTRSVTAGITVVGSPARPMGHPPR